MGQSCGLRRNPPARLALGRAGSITCRGSRWNRYSSENPAARRSPLADGLELFSVYAIG